MSENRTEVLADRYRLVSLVGEGGMGRVWAARDELLGREVAIKELVPPSGLTAREREDVRERVIREARAIALINHPNVVRVFDVLYERGEPWIVMELIRSRSLFDAVREDGPLAPERVAEVGLGVLAGLCAAHEAGLLHRDVKPANVLLAYDGRVVLTDFGVALVAGDSAMTSAGVLLGSPSYLAPERALDEPIGPAADLWSLGATLYAAVEGRPPYTKSSAVATLTAIAGSEPLPAPARAGALRPALYALLRKDPAVRADATTAERLLRAAAEGRTPAAVASPAEAPVAGRRRWPRIAVGALAAALLVLSVTLVLNGREDRPLMVTPVAQPSVPSGPLEFSAVPPAPPLASSPAGPAAAPVAPASPAVRKAGERPRPVRSSAAAKPATSKKAAVGGIDPARWYTISNRISGMCVDVRESNTAVRTPVQQFACTTSEAQKFRFVPTDGGYMRIATRLDTTKNLDVKDESKADHALIQLWTYNGAQQWRAVSEGGGYYHFIGRASGKCLDLPKATTAEWVQLELYTCLGKGAQSFRLNEL
ncbi:RICIN domain-containing protein [Actinoplanes sp. NPDC051470]|uniref:serine/threonine protein kinase n=1 Tax=Actinoplanes sp. NPDC051470 TaxID=3157224 RepID=UPI0034187BF2